MGLKAGTTIKAYQILGDNSRPGFPFLGHKKRPKSNLIFLKSSHGRHEHEATESTEVEHVFHMKGGDGETMPGTLGFRLAFHFNPLQTI